MFPRINWGNIPEDETVVASLFNEGGYTTGLVFDTWHIKDHGFFFDRGFQSWEWIRGQEGDRYRALPANPPLPCHPDKLRDADEVKQHLRNQAGVTQEDQYCVARTIQAAVNWLEHVSSANQFYLHIDCFDPHEPWDPPAKYVDLYSPGYTGERVISPAYAPPTYLTEDELVFAKALYAAEITMVDHWLGVLFEALDTMHLSENTVVVFCSDHGFLLGEHNRMGKSWEHEGHRQAYPLYAELNHVPLMIRLPDVAHQRLSALAQPVDIMPTVLDYAGIDIPANLHGVSLRSSISDPTQPSRQIAVSSRSLSASLALKPLITVTDGEWALLYGAAHTASELYHLENDPGQENNLIDTECTMAQTLHAQFVDLLTAIETPEDTLSTWTRSPCSKRQGVAPERSSCSGRSVI
jgi:arylsulfatase A-like enzyme